MGPINKYRYKRQKGREIAKTPGIPGVWRRRRSFPSFVARRRSGSAPLLAERSAPPFCLAAGGSALRPRSRARQSRQSRSSGRPTPSRGRSARGAAGVADEKRKGKGDFGYGRPETQQAARRSSVACNQMHEHIKNIRSVASEVIRVVHKRFRCRSQGVFRTRVARLNLMGGNQSRA
jgi:hypothetical protein